MTQPAASTSTNPLYPRLETQVAPLQESEEYDATLRIEKEFVTKLNGIIKSKDLLEDVGDRLVLPSELFQTSKKVSKPKIDPLKRLNELPTDEVEDEEETEDEEEEDEEVVEDEEEDAGGDYLVSHFDNGENFEDNDEEGDDMTI